MPRQGLGLDEVLLLQPELGKFSVSLEFVRAGYWEVGLELKADFGEDSTRTRYPVR